MTALSGLDDVAALERRFADQLGTERRRSSRPAELEDAGRAWSQAVWHAARLAGPAALAAHDRDVALRVAACPIFVCGAHRSGTTLVRDLLDDHPALAMLPSEGTYFGTWSERLDRPDAASFLGEFTGEWLRRLADPNSQPPRWALGRSDAVASPYVAFARAVLAFDALMRTDAPASAPAAPLLAVALAFAWCRGGGRLPSTLRAWGEKTPGNERRADALRAMFPAARIVHVIRHPEDVLASRRAADAAAGVESGLHGVIDEIGRSLEIAAAASSRGEASGHRVVKYEDLLADPETVMRGVADFLDVEWTPALLRPTVAGIVAPSNSSFEIASGAAGIVSEVRASRRERLPRAQREMLAAALGQPAAALGYSLEELGGARRAWRRLQLGLRPRL